MAPLRLKVFKAGNSLALRLPKSLGMVEGEELLGFQEGEALVLRHLNPLGWPEHYFSSWEAATFELPKRGEAKARAGRLDRISGR